MPTSACDAKAVCVATAPAVAPPSLRAAVGSCHNCNRWCTHIPVHEPQFSLSCPDSTSGSLHRLQPRPSPGLATCIRSSGLRCLYVLAPTARSPRPLSGSTFLDSRPAPGFSLRCPDSSSSPLHRLQSRTSPGLNPCTPLIACSYTALLLQAMPVSWALLLLLIHSSSAAVHALCAVGACLPMHCVL